MTTTLSRDEQDRDRDIGGVAAIDADEQRDRGDRGALGSENPHDRAQAPAPQREHRRDKDDTHGDPEQLAVQVGAHDQPRNAAAVTAKNATTNDTASSSGTRNSRILAVNTSNAASPAPMTASFATNDDGAECDRGRPGRGRDPPRHEQIDEQRTEQQESHRGGELDEREIRTCVLEDHGLVDHGQFEVRARIVDRQARALGQRRDRERDEREEALHRQH